MKRRRPVFRTLLQWRGGRPGKSERPGKMGDPDDFARKKHEFRDRMMVPSPMIQIKIDSADVAGAYISIASSLHRRQHKMSPDSAQKCVQGRLIRSRRPAFAEPEIRNWEIAPYLGVYDHRLGAAACDVLRNGLCGSCGTDR
ncbi:hypothetical protein PRIPAC_74818 [Pristionchus pacificus]|uniref:Uncharacterized protein n=1 Tax=Pristionchus pacificus TaxID=54126 RepID=A0A2A6C8Q4_PRIPA|nr:hypothetical protein PRIPAC_74818 [Pristionchus pacificus]|eukprot:PDM74423.1 hypothetical protein PRIPAC_41779 [Pristionchus pacificus]